MIMTKKDRQPYSLTRGQVKKLCEQYMIKGMALATIAFAEEMGLSNDELQACVERTNHYEYADKDNLVKLNEMVEIFCKARGLEGFKFL